MLRRRDSTSSSSDSDYNTSSTLDLADQITILLNDGRDEGPGPKKPPIVVDPRTLSRRSGRLEDIIRPPPRKLSKNQISKNQKIAAKNALMARNMQQPNKYGRNATTNDNILTFKEADKRAMNLHPKYFVNSEDTEKKGSGKTDNTRRGVNKKVADDIWVPLKSDGYNLRAGKPTSSRKALNKITRDID